MTKFLFLDLETTGLVPTYDRILEIAWVITDDQFNIVDPGASCVVDHGTQWGQAFGTIRAAKDIVQKMHTESGLLNEVLTSKDLVPLDRVYQLLIASIERVAGEGEPVHLAGFSVHFDKDFLLANDFGGLFDDELGLIHHRHLDLSSVKLILDSAGVPWTKAANSGPHRAAADVLESVQQAMIFRDLLARLSVDAL